MDFLYKATLFTIIFIIYNVPKFYVSKTLKQTFKADASKFLGGLSLHLNHLIASRMANYDWSFGTLPFGLFGSNWTQGTLRHILGQILVIFEICQFLTISGPFEYFSENGWSQKIKVFLMKERSLPPYRFSFRRRGP